MTEDPHDHDHGLAHDLRQMVGRRSVLAALGLAGAGAAWLTLARGSTAQQTATAADGSTCLTDPQETAGPYPGDGTNVKDGQTVNVLTESGVQRSDLRPSFGDYSGAAEGTQIDLLLTLVDVGKACTPLAGHAVYLWHCDTQGHYSLYDLPDQNHLRGVGVTDAKGQVRFTTIFPGCYDGRWPHMHFEVFASAEAAQSGDNSLLISQFAMPEAVARNVYAADSRYEGSLDRLGHITLASDNVFSDNTAEALAVQTPAISGDPASGLTGTVTIGIVTA